MPAVFGLEIKFNITSTGKDKTDWLIQSRSFTPKPPSKRRRRQTVTGTGTDNEAFAPTDAEFIDPTVEGPDVGIHLFSYQYLFISFHLYL